MKTFTALAALIAAVAIPGVAGAQESAPASTGSRREVSIVGSDYAVDPIFVPSPEQFTAELRIGAYQPSLGGAFNTTFRGDLGPQIGAELDVHVWRIPFVGPIAIGASFAWAEWSGPGTTTDTSATNVGETGLSLINFNALLVLRIDALARYVQIPLVFSGKIGPDFGFWSTGTEGVTEADGWSVGLRWAAQVALELDFLEPRAARRLDDEWGINHSEIFFELFGSTMGMWGQDMLPVGTDLAWAAGLGFTF